MHYVPSCTQVTMQFVTSRVRCRKSDCEHQPFESGFLPGSIREEYSTVLQASELLRQYGPRDPFLSRRSNPGIAQTARSIAYSMLAHNSESSQNKAVHLFLNSTPLLSSESLLLVVEGRENCEEDQHKNKSEKDGQCEWKRER
ncbi:hypothetical protein B0H13DRAFT_1857561 [Mycena leptocephala]|nr:hypothetical protein B0H13DRAFT_1857561 [Mycena leptocephala]